MSQRAKELAQRVRTFSDEVIAYVENLSDDDWGKICDWEQWTVGVTAYHIGKGHLSIYELAGMMVQGQELPQLDMDQINDMSKKQAQEYTNCTKAEALDFLRQNSAKMIEFITGLNDDQLDIKGSMPAFDGEVTTEQLIDYVLFQSAGHHLENIKAAVNG